jgi:hypothetical protein
LLRLRSDSQPEPEFSGFFVHIHTYLVQPKTRADPGIKLVSPGRPPPPGDDTILQYSIVFTE